MDKKNYSGHKGKWPLGLSVLKTVDSGLLCLGLL